MNDLLQKRLSELRTEFECGQKMVAELEARQANVRSSLLRISGAIQVLEELLGDTVANPVPPRADTVSSGTIGR